MNKSCETIPVQNICNLWEYVLLIRPTKEVNEKIIEEKRRFETFYEIKLHRDFESHITVAGFFAKDGMEPTLIRWIQNICNLQKGFTVTLNNYGGSPSCGLFLRIQYIDPFKKLANSLKILNGFLESNECPTLYLVSKPQLNFTKRLSHFEFETAIKEFAQKTFHTSFSADKLFLLKRKDEPTFHHVNAFVLPHL